MPTCHIFLMTVSAERKVCAASVAGRGNASKASAKRRRLLWRILAPVEVRSWRAINRKDRCARVESGAHSCDLQQRIRHEAHSLRGFRSVARVRAGPAGPSDEREAGLAMDNGQCE